MELGAVVKEFSSAFGVSEDEAGPILRKFGETVTAPYRASLERGAAQLEQIGGIVTTLLMGSARSRLGERFPQLEAGDFTSDEVTTKTHSLLGTGSYRDMDPLDAAFEAMSDAVGVVHRQKLVEAARSEVSKERAARDRGTPKPSGSRLKKKPTTEFERASSWLAEREAAEGLE